MNYWCPQPYFVDKSMVIREFLKSRHKGIVISAPQGFLKTSNIRMIASFLAAADDDEYLEQRERQLCSLEIKKENQLICRYFGRYPVVLLTFGLTKSLYTVDSMIELFRRCFEHHQFLLSSPKLTTAQKATFRIYLNYRHEYVGISQKKVADALKTLCELLYTHYEKKVFVFIDDYDYPLLEAITNGKPMCNIQPFVQKMLTGVYESPVVKKILLTGITSLTGILGCDFKIYKFLHDHPFSKYYGFTEDEIYQIANNDRCSVEIINEILTNAYTTITNTRLYSPEWVHDFLKHKFIENDIHFKDIFSKPILRNPIIQAMAETLLEGKELKFSLFYFKLPLNLLQLNRLLNGSAGELEPEEVELLFLFLYEFGFFTLSKGKKNITFSGCLTRNPKIKLVLSSTSRGGSYLKQILQ